MSIASPATCQHDQPPGMGDRIDLHTSVREKCASSPMPLSCIINMATCDHGTGDSPGEDGSRQIQPPPLSGQLGRDSPIQLVTLPHPPQHHHAGIPTTRKHTFGSTSDPPSPRSDSPPPVDEHRIPQGTTPRGNYQHGWSAYEARSLLIYSSVYRVHGR